MSSDRLDRIREHLARAEVSRQPGLSLHLYLAAEDVAWLVASLVGTQDLRETAERERDAALARAKRAEADLAECYRLTGADPDGDDDAHLARYAAAEVRRMRTELDEVEDTLDAVEASFDEALAERNRAVAEVSSLRALLAEPSGEQMERWLNLCKQVWEASSLPMCCPLCGSPFHPWPPTMEVSSE